VLRRFEINFCFPGVDKIADLPGVSISVPAAQLASKLELAFPFELHRRLVERGCRIPVESCTRP
jgi:hypothetical protein